MRWCEPCWSTLWMVPTWIAVGLGSFFTTHWVFSSPGITVTGSHDTVYDWSIAVAPAPVPVPVGPPLPPAPVVPEAPGALETEPQATVPAARRDTAAMRRARV